MALGVVEIDTINYCLKDGFYFAGLLRGLLLRLA